MKRKLKLIITSNAIVNVADAFEYYEFSQTGLGDYFLESLEAAYLSVTTNPEMHRLAFDNFRQVKLKNFPHLVIYSIEGEEIIVAKVFNTYQNPLKKIR